MRHNAREETRKLLSGESATTSSSDERFSDSEVYGRIAKYASTTDNLESNAYKKRGFIEKVPTRYILTLLSFLGFVNVYALRVNLNVAMVAMVTLNKTENMTEECPTDDVDKSNSTSTDLQKPGEFYWDESLQGFILGAFFYGYVVTQIPGGRLAESLGTKWLFGGGVLTTAALTLLTPLAARLHYSALIVVRILEGLGEGVTFPAMHAMLARWMPKSERGLQSTLIYSGAQIGTVIAMPISGYLCDSDFLGGWPAVFYVFGFTGCVWFVFWALLVSSTPSEHPRISLEELRYIEESQGDEKAQNKTKTPWRAIASSPAVYALAIAHFGQNWGFYTLLTELPSYMKNIMHFDVKDNGIFNAIPYLLQAIVGWGSAYLADMVRRKGKVSTSVIRKFCNTVAFVGPAVCLLGVTLLGCNFKASLALFALSMAFNGFSYPGYCVTHVDMTPDFAGTLMGITNGFANIAGFMVPWVVGLLTKDNQTLYRWSIVFYLAIGCYLTTAVIFLIFGSAELQPWGIGVKEDDGSVNRSKSELDLSARNLNPKN